MLIALYKKQKKTVKIKQDTKKEKFHGKSFNSTKNILSVWLALISVHTYKKHTHMHTPPQHGDFQDNMSFSLYTQSKGYI